MAEASSSTTYQLDPNRIFYKVGGKRLGERMPVVTEIFNRVLKPLYGSQEKALSQIKQSADRTLFLLYDRDDPVGVLQYKTEPSDEFAALGINKSIEIKSLFVNQSQNNSGRGLGSALYNKLVEETQKLPHSFTGYHVTVSEDKQESLRFFQKKGFQIVHTWKGRYHADKEEHLLFCPASGREAQPSMVPRGEDIQSTEEPELVHVIHNAHSNDVHAFLRISGDTFVTGSKDNTIVEWDGRTRKVVRVVNDVEPAMEAQERWITSLAKVNDRLYLSGTRNGVVDLWKTSGEHHKTIRIKTPKGGHKSLRENAHRINCIAPTLDRDIPGFFAGLPTQFDEVDIITSRTTHITSVHKNDWVFSIHPIDPERVLCVVGCTIEAYQREGDAWQHTETLFPEPKPTWIPQEHGRAKKQRAFIQSMVPMLSDPNRFTLARLDGSVQVIDIESKKVVCNWKEHERRVWHALPLTEHVIASSGEDQTIRLWDVRQAKSTHTIKSPVGPINAMMRWDDQTLIAATTPLEKSPESCGTQLRFYDIR